MRFNSPEEVKAAAEKWAAELYRLHVEKGHDLNPYATPGGRSDFERAFSDAPRYSWETLPEWDYRYQVGQAVARLVKTSQGADHA